MYRYVICALVLAGCALPQSTFSQPADLYNPPAKYANYYDALYADFFWRCVSPERGGVRVEGYAVSSLRNNMAFFNFEVRLFARDAKGDVLADRWTYGDTLGAVRLEPVSFAVSVQAAGEEVRYELYYRFETMDGGGQARGGGRGQQVQPVVFGAGMEYFGTIQDVCGDRWRRKDVPHQS
ncbi:MAG: hypothetical protein ACE5JQ_13075 [Candidatus Methylomirabilales bacterium]